MKFMKPAALAVLTTFAPMAIMPAYAGMATGQQAQQWQNEVLLSDVQSYLQQADVQAELQRMGVSQELAAERVAGMTNAELAELNDRIADAPAGASVAGVVGVVFIVLIVLELVGVIDIFKAR